MQRRTTVTRIYCGLVLRQLAARGEQYSEQSWHLIHLIARPEGMNAWKCICPGYNKNQTVRLDRFIHPKLSTRHFNGVMSRNKFNIIKRRWISWMMKSHSLIGLNNICLILDYLNRNTKVAATAFKTSSTKDCPNSIMWCENQDCATCNAGKDRTLSQSQQTKGQHCG